MGIKNLINSLKHTPFYRGQLRDVIKIAEKPPVFTENEKFSVGIKKYLESRGIENLYSHQTEVIKKIRQDKNTAITTPTASGKTLAFNIPVLEAVEKEKVSALYLYPAKALSNDQHNILKDIKKKSGLNFEPGIYDGDTPSGKKKYIRENCDVVISNPYMLHQILSYHNKWKKFYRRLKYIVIDEAHKYRGVFGSNISLLIRRLRRILKMYKSGPVFIISTASLANPLAFTHKLTGLDFELVSESGSPAGEKSLVLWDSSKLPDRSVSTQTKDILIHTTKNNFQTLCFIASRRMAELIRKWANMQDPSIKILSYRAGYSPADRREIEQKLKKGEIKGVVSTEALELGIDIGQLDVIILSGYPGSISSFWQMAGRAGRKMQESAVFFMPHEDALQKYLLKNPKILTDMNFESAVVSTENININTGHILCSLSEAPAPSKKIFDGIETEKIMDTLIKKGLVAETPRGYIYSGGARPQEVVSLDNIESGEIKIKVNGKILETMDKARAFREAHEGAVHLHNGKSYVISRLSLEEGAAYAFEDKVDYYTQAVKKEDVKIIETKETKKFGRFTLNFGGVLVKEMYHAYRIKKSGIVVAQKDLALPPLKFNTEAVWLEIKPTAQEKLESENLDFDGALHAAEHGLIALSPLIAMCDTNDLGGYSYPSFGDEGAPVIFIYDAYEGGIGISKTLFNRFSRLASATTELIEKCGCESGCPSCVYSARCGNNNNPIDKAGSVVLLKYLAG